MLPCPALACPMILPCPCLSHDRALPCLSHGSDLPCPVLPCPILPCPCLSHDLILICPCYHVIPELSYPAPPLPRHTEAMLMLMHSQSRIVSKPMCHAVVACNSVCKLECIVFCIFTRHCLLIDDVALLCEQTGTMRQSADPKASPSPLPPHPSFPACKHDDIVMAYHTV